MKEILTLKKCSLSMVPFVRGSNYFWCESRLSDKVLRYNMFLRVFSSNRVGKVVYPAVSSDSRRSCIERSSPSGMLF